MDLPSLFPDFFRRIDAREIRRSTNDVLRMPCPLHERKGQRNLACWLGSEGKLVFWCCAGCGKLAILASLSLGWDATFPERKGKPRRAIRVERSHVYEDADGRVIYRKAIGRDKDGGKFGWWQRWDADVEQWVNGLQGVASVPYMLPELIATAPRLVHLVEGEKDADELASLGFVATTGGGSGQWLSAWSGEHLAGRPVAVWPDADAAGERHALAVCGSLLLAGCPSVRLHRWPEDAPKGWDVADELDRLRKGGADEEALAAWVRDAVRAMDHWGMSNNRRAV